MQPPRKSENELILGLVSISDRASKGIYDDRGIPELEAWCRKAITNPLTVHKRLIADERFDIEKTLRELVDIIGCDLILTTGGTGPSRRDVTPEATLAVGTREMPGFGEQMRAISGHFVPTAILSRQVAVLRETPDHAALIINLPGQPKAIAETLEGLKDESGKSVVNGIFAAVPYCIDLIGGPYIETNESVVKAFRPKSARRPKATEQTEAAKPVQSAAEPEKPALPAVKPFDAKDILMVQPRRAQTAPEAAVVWLHGMGVDNTDFAPFPDEILQFGGPVCRFVMPNAPVREISAHPGYPLRAWYDVRSDKIDDREDRAGIREMAARVSLLLESIEKTGVPYQINEGDGAFYGPKLDFHVQDSLGRTWQCGTIQMDMQLPERFDVNYIGEDGEKHRAVMLHRAGYGSLERFIGILIEHYAGAFPTWIAPVQAKIIPVTDKNLEYAKSVAAAMSESDIRVEVEEANETLGYKIRKAQMEKVPYMIIVGDQEMKGHTISVRSRKNGDQGTQSLPMFVANLIREIKEREN